MGLVRPVMVMVMGFLPLLLLLGFSHAHQWYVGERDGWVLKPSEDYNHWAERHRFQVNDTLYFGYQKGSDSVLVVNKDDYYSCNTKNPMLSLTDGNSVFKLDRSGPFFFISGHGDNCNQGQRLIVVVLAVRHRNPPPSSPSPSPSPPPPSPPQSPSPQPSARSTPPFTTPPPVSSPQPTPAAKEAHAPAPSTATNNNHGSVIKCSIWLVLSVSIALSVM